MKDLAFLLRLYGDDVPRRIFVAMMNSNNLELASKRRRTPRRVQQKRRVPRKRKVTVGHVRVYSTASPSMIIGIQQVHDRLNRQVSSGVLLEFKLLPVMLTPNWSLYRFGTANSL